MIPNMTIFSWRYCLQVFRLQIWSYYCLALLLTSCSRIGSRRAFDANWSIWGRRSYTNGYFRSLDQLHLNSTWTEGGTCARYILRLEPSMVENVPAGHCVHMAELVAPDHKLVKLNTRQKKLWTATDSAKWSSWIYLGHLNTIQRDKDCS